MKQEILNFLREEKGVTAIEYGLIAGLIAVLLVVSIDGIGEKLSALFGYIKDELPAPPA